VAEGVGKPVCGVVKISFFRNEESGEVWMKERRRKIEKMWGQLLKAFDEQTNYVSDALRYMSKRRQSGVGCRLVCED
jgi:hypothetical protein